MVSTSKRPSGLAAYLSPPRLTPRSLSTRPDPHHSSLQRTHHFLHHQPTITTVLALHDRLPPCAQAQAYPAAGRLHAPGRVQAPGQGNLNNPRCQGVRVARAQGGPECEFGQLFGVRWNVGSLGGRWSAVELIAPAPPLATRPLSSFIPLHSAPPNLSAPLHQQSADPPFFTACSCNLRSRPSPARPSRTGSASLPSSAPASE